MTRAEPAPIVLLIGLLLGGCSSTQTDGSGNDAGNICNAVIAQQADEGNLHRDDCFPVQYESSPPSSGNHYNDWAMYKTYSAPVPWGFLVHSLEHGAVVITYNCPDGCDADVASAQRAIDAAPADLTCGARARPRLILAPDPTLPVGFAASAWRWTLRADCFDPIAFSHFIADHYAAAGTERICGGGVDLSSTGWCP
jgi:hypothetical protein